MEMFTEWITRIVLFLLLAMVADALLPSGLMKKYARLVMSILLLLIFLGPLLQLLKINPHQLMNAAEYQMNQQMNAETIEENIEKKKSEILKGQDAYKLEQVSEALVNEIKEPLLKEQQLLVVGLEMTFEGDFMDMDSLDKLYFTLRHSPEDTPVEIVDISIMEAPVQEDDGSDEEVRKWIAEKLDLPFEQIEIRWEDKDE
ncbi:stage III sporulation protein AF [Halobacillus yeomjeoni]|uniref:Stage III sporulation protein AF n=1 Tax=Halobacillus yeomjeoni TaxID=311194 RepID=A0A931HUU4_9BACI|nr:stage III sporulation protein AF [Halobacillus yeomjeoni]MBH0229834.1 stage III sporulation protein AF [Halobacillus yeomjeoni]